MTSSVRFRAEIRGVAGPCFGVVTAQVCGFFASSILPTGAYTELILVWLGIPLLATLPFGNEFQHGTLSSLLSQPVNRLVIWKEKFIAAGAAALAMTLLGLALYRPGSDVETAFLTGLTLIWVAVSLCSAVFWTLLARSTIGAVALNTLQLLGFAAAVTVLDIARVGPFARLSGLGLAAFGAAIIYAAFMLWLGRRKLARFEVSGIGPAAGLDTGRFGTDWLAGLLRSRRGEATLNLVRKEVRLLWPLWLLTLGGAAFVLCMAPLRLVSAGTSPWATNIPLVVVVLLSVLAAMLSGSVSLGEERSAGTHQWHMTLPTSPRRQWLVKLLTAVVSCLACVSGLLALSRAVLGEAFVRETDALHTGDLDFLASIAFITVAAFWCATSTKGTLRAVLWVFPAIGLLGLASNLGFWLGRDALAESTLVEAAMIRFYPFPVPFHGTGIRAFAYAQTMASPWIALPFLLIGAWQSYRQFRTEPSDRASSVFRRLAGPAIFLFAGCFVLQAPVGLSSIGERVGSRVFEETALAVEAMNLPDRKGKVETLHFPISALHQARPLSDLARRWLRDAPVTVERRLWTFTRPQEFDDGTTGYTAEGTFIYVSPGRGWKCRVDTGMLNYRFRYWSCRAGHNEAAGSILSPLKQKSPTQ